MRTRKTLLDRYISRVRKAGSIMHSNQHVRVEMDRLARQVMRLRAAKVHMHNDYVQALNDVLTLIKEAKR